MYIRHMQKPATHYLQLFANNDETASSRKKKSFAKSDEKGSTHYLSQTPVLANMLQKRKIRRKKFFDFVKKQPTPENTFCEKVFRETLTNMTNYSTHYPQFARISSIRSFFVIVHEQCVAGQRWNCTYPNSRRIGKYRIFINILGRSCIN